MRVDIGNCLASVASPGISRAALEHLDERVAAGHERIEAGRKDGAFGYAALDLPETTNVAAITQQAERFRDYDAVLTIGIGGSALGAATIAHPLAGRTTPDHHVLDNVDPDTVQRLLDRLRLEKTVVNVVSRSGQTTETMANFLIVREALEGADVDWTERTVVTTGETGHLRRLAMRHDLPLLAVPESVPGRYSALSAVGLFPAAVQSVDLDAVIEGAADEADRLGASLFDSPAYAYGAVAEALGRRGAGVNVMMPYAEALEPFAEWFAQLWAESLGKDGLGQFPVRALGATDQHSQLQLYRAGPRNALVSFLRPRERTDVSIPESVDDEFDYLHETSLGALLDAELAATEASLAEAGRPSLRIEIDRLDEAGLGELIYGMEAACVLAGELQGIDPFDQPAVEWGKRATRDFLSDEPTDVSEEIGEKTTLWIG